MNIGFPPETLIVINSLESSIIETMISFDDQSYVNRRATIWIAIQWIHGAQRGARALGLLNFLRENFPRPRALCISFVIRPQHTRYLRSFRRGDFWIFIIIIFSLLAPGAQKTELFCDPPREANTERETGRMRVAPGINYIPLLCTALCIGCANRATSLFPLRLVPR